MKVGFFSTMRGETWAASEYLWSQAARSLIADGHSVGLSIAPDMLKAKEILALRELGSRLFPQKRHSLARYRRIERFFPSACGDFFGWLPDVVCISQGSLTDMLWLPDLLRELNAIKVPYIIITHFNADSIVLPEDQRQLCRRLSDRAFHHFFVSNHNWRLAERQLAQALRNASVLTGSRLDVSSPMPWPDASGTIRMACVGRLLAEWKGQDVLIESLADPELLREDWDLTFYGSGKDKPYLEDLARFYGISDRIHFGGFVDGLDKLWSGHHLHVLAARGEGGPLVTLEAMLRGRFCVTTDVGRNRDFIEDGVSGFIAEAPTAFSFRSALKRALGARSQWPEIAHAAVERARSFLEDDPVVALVSRIEEAVRAGGLQH